MKLKKFFEERLKLRKATRHAESRGADSSDHCDAAAAAASGKAALRVTAAAVHQCPGGGAACRCPACTQPNGQPRFHASAPAAVGLRADYQPSGAHAGRGRLVCDAGWVRPPAGVHSVADAAAPPATAASPAGAADRSWCATIAEAAAEAECEPLAPDQYYTVPRCRSRIKTNPWIPTPHSITCREGAPCLCRRQSDTTAAAGGTLLPASAALGRLLPVDDDATVGRETPSSPRPCCYDGGGGFSSGESGYATTVRRCGGADCSACDDEACLSLNDDDYYDWHEMLLEAFTPVTRGDSVSSYDETESPSSSVGHAHCSGIVAENVEWARAPPPTVAGRRGVGPERGGRDDEDADARCLSTIAATATSEIGCAERALGIGLTRVPHEDSTGLAARVRRLREYKSVLHEKIRLARIECQLILSGLSPDDRDGGRSGDEEAR